MTATELLGKMRTLLGKDLDADEGFRFGDQTADVRGVIVCWMCDPDAIAAAAKAGANIIICHEALYFPYDIVDGGHFGSRERDFLAWPTNVQRIKLLSQHNITVIRLHASVDRLCIFDVFAAQLGFTEVVVDQPNFVKLFEIVPRPIAQLAREIKQKLELSGIRVACKNPQRVVRRLGVPWGGLGLFVNVSYVNSLLPYKPEVMIAGETDNYGFRFVTELGIDVIETSHEVSEDKGLEEFARRAGQVVDVPVRYFRNPVVWKMM